MLTSMFFCLRLVSEKIKFWKKNNSPNHVSSVRAQNVSNQHHWSKHFLFHQKGNEHYKCKKNHTFLSLVFE